MRIIAFEFAYLESYSVMDIGGSFTAHLLAQADIKRGARALDIGCGSGDVALRLAEAVGEEGEVLGIDLSAQVLEKAQQKAEKRCFQNVTFAQMDVQDLAKESRQFDIITCRRVLMYLPSQIEIASLIRAALRPSGCFIAHEHDASVLQSSDKLPLYEQARSWIWETVRSEGANIRTGFDLYSILDAAGFSNIEISAEAIVLTPSSIGSTAGIIDAIADRIEAAGVATKAEINIETLEQRLIEERMALAATTVGEMMFGAIAKP